MVAQREQSSKTYERKESKKSKERQERQEGQEVREARESPPDREAMLSAASSGLMEAFRGEFEFWNISCICFTWPDHGCLPSSPSSSIVAPCSPAASSPSFPSPSGELISVCNDLERGQRHELGRTERQARDKRGKEF
jgi:hypothetical protein